MHRTWLISTLGITAGSTAVLVSNSTDGLHWSAPVAAVQKPNDPTGIALDKEWIACDNGATSPFRGHCYLSYSDIERVQLVTQTSVDGGNDLVARGRRARQRRSARNPGAVRTRRRNRVALPTERSSCRSSTTRSP